jgi:hypothetical protein
MIHKILITVNNLLNDAFVGLEEGNISQFSGNLISTLPCQADFISILLTQKRKVMIL